MKKRLHLPVNLGDDHFHKKQRLQEKCKVRNSSDFDHKLVSEKLD